MKKKKIENFKIEFENAKKIAGKFCAVIPDDASNSEIACAIVYFFKFFVEESVEPKCQKEAFLSTSELLKMFANDLEKEGENCEIH